MLFSIKNFSKNGQNREKTGIKQSNMTLIYEFRLEKGWFRLEMGWFLDKDGNKEKEMVYIGF